MASGTASGDPCADVRPESANSKRIDMPRYRPPRAKVARLTAIALAQAGSGDS